MDGAPRQLSLARAAYENIALMTSGRSGKGQLPKAFISHASEDKKPFVLEFATRLRTNGVEAWVDRWEMQAGDSLVRRIFEEGIDEANLFISIVSRNSVSKPWVREELDAGMVRKINEKCRLIPIVLDDVAVPAALQHILWLPVSTLGLDGVVAETVRIAHGSPSERPPLGSPPGYVTAAQPAVRYGVGLDDPADRTVLTEIISEFRKWPPNSQIMSDEIATRCEAAGIDRASFHESMQILSQRRVIEAMNILSSTRWWITKIRPDVWLDAAAADGIDIADLQNRLMIAVVNGHEGADSWENPAAYLGIDQRTTTALLSRLQQLGILKYHDTNHGPKVWKLEPGARRIVRKMTNS